MGRPPACIFVIRHGNRLDIADKQWHLSSPTPYDTPLTYGGWQQAKMLGARIGAIIRERALEEEKAARVEETTDGAASTRRKRRKYKIVLHSSPFLRCIQTSIAISAGLAQDSSPFEASPAPVPSPIQIPGTRPTVHTNFSGTGASHQVRRSVLRLDAFLGEWMNPDYFELITPPPESVMMLASAKADLLRRENYQAYPGLNTENLSNPQSQLWGTPTSAKPTSPNGFANLSGLASSLPRSESVGGQSSQPLQPSSAPLPPPADLPGGYVSPVPNYAISSGGTIPMGFVSHAKDACVDIDYQWDSMREPLDWGSGGTYGEEWANMHKRFRKGLQSLVDWYSTEESPYDMVTKMATRRDPAAQDAPAAETEEDVEIESIVILVSHGAGCNAMIGAITHQPALTEVSMASLTMAVRKPGKDSSDAHDDDDPFERATHDKTKGLIPLHRFYDMRMIGSTEHLRSATPTPSSTRSSAMASVFGGTRSRHANSLSSALSNFSYSDTSESRGSSANTALGNMRRSSGSTGVRSTFGAGGATGGITVGSGRSSFTSTNAKPFALGRTPSIGLWSPITPPGDEDEEEDDDMLLNFGHETEVKKTNGDAAAPVSTASMPKDAGGSEPLASTSNQVEQPALSPSRYAEQQKQEPLQKLGMGAGGLWGASPPSTAIGEAIHDMSSTKRRWTVNERA